MNILHSSSHIRAIRLRNLTHLSSNTFKTEGEDSILLRNVGIQPQDGITVQKATGIRTIDICYIRTGMSSRNDYSYSLNNEGESRGCLWWGWQGAGLRRELCLPLSTLSTPGAAERRSSGVCRDALTPRLQADMSLTLRVKYFQLSVKCKGEKITKVDFRGEYRQPCRNSQFRSTIFPGFTD